MQSILLRCLRYLGYIFPYLHAKIAYYLFVSPQRYPRNKKELLALQSATRIQVSKRLVVWSWGKGPVVLALHGWAGRGSQFSSFVESITRNGFKLIAIDGPAHGDSAGKTTNIGEFAKNLLLLQKQLGPIHALIGHSFGGLAGLLATSRGLNLKKIVLIASPQNVEGIVNSYSRRMRFNPRSLKQFQNLIEQNAKIKIEEADGTILIKKLKIQGLVIHDEKDEVLPLDRSLITTAQEYKWQTVVTHHLGHKKILYSTEVVKQVSEFLIIQD